MAIDQRILSHYLATDLVEYRKNARRTWEFLKFFDHFAVVTQIRPHTSNLTARPLYGPCSSI